MTINIQLDENEITKLKVLADDKGVSVEILARQVVVDLLSKSDDPEFDRIIERVLSRNTELYRRLS